MPERRRPYRAALLAGLLALPIALAAQKNRDVEKIGQRDINKGSLNLYSLEREIQVGRQLAADVEASSHLLRDARVQGYVEDLVQNLVRNSDANVPFTVRVIDSDELNAFALPGGFLYVHTGLISEARTEAELAGVLAHEIAHVTARHATKQASKAQLFSWLSIPLIFVGGPVAYGVSQAMNVAGPLAFLKFSRNAEREADFLGLQYSYRAGYDPTGLIDFLERIKRKESESRLSKLFSTHPMTRDRVQRAQKAMASVLPPRDEYVVTTSRFEETRRHLRRLREMNSIYRLPDDDDELRIRRRTEDSGGGDRE
jgi:predicted Zn-dependent protease